MTYYNVSKVEFLFAINAARAMRPLIAQNTAHPSDLPGEDTAEYYLHADDLSGFGLQYTLGGIDLISVFTVIRGRGEDILSYAQHLGATTLDCYEGFLPEYYTKRGWVEYAREKNWHGATLPDVVFMYDPANQERA